VVAEDMITGSSVEFGDELSGGSQHDRVESCGPVGDPSRAGGLRCGGDVADMNAAMIKVEVERLWFAFVESE
jgi:hypothetical protein